MGSSLESERQLSREFIAAFQRRASPTGVLDYADFVRLALYDPAVGYYTQPRPRVGYAPGTDFFTSATSGPIFGELVVAAGVKLLRDRDPRQHVFVEIGAEPGHGVLDEVAHPFAGYRKVRIGDPIDLTGNAIVFSNELFDAQPFRRFIFRDGAWRELGVALRGDRLEETPVNIPERTPRDRVPDLPTTAVDGYVIDAPSGSAELMEAVAALPWTGLFVACDYGKSWREIVEALPAGTARGYYRHTQTTDLLVRPGEQDLTCHICWDWLEIALRRHGFGEPQLETQEAFFIRHAEAYLSPAVSADAGQLTPRKRSILQLLHAAHLGQKFQVLHALR